MDDNEREAFVADYKARLSKAYPTRTDGATLFPFKRLFAVAHEGRHAFQQGVRAAAVAHAHSLEGEQRCSSAQVLFG